MAGLGVDSGVDTVAQTASHLEPDTKLESGDAVTVPALRRS